MSPKRHAAKGRTVRGAEGFRRFNLYGNAIDPCDLRTLLDPFSADDQRDAEDLLSQRQARKFKDGLQVLDKISAGLFQKQARFRSSCPVVNFILATDKSDDKARAHAIVARAYWRADEYAHACAQLLDDAEDAKTHASAIEKALDALRIPVAEAIRINEAWRYEHSDKKRSRRQDVADGVSALSALADQLQAFSQLHLRQGRPSDDARFFFVLRLAEAFSIWTGRPPDFHNADKRHGLWSEFAYAALDLTGLNHEDDLDYTFRRLGGAGPRAKAFLAWKELSTPAPELDPEGSGFSRPPGLIFQIMDWINDNAPHSYTFDNGSGLIDKVGYDDVEEWIDAIFDSGEDDFSDDTYYSLGKNLVLEALSALLKSKDELKKLWKQSQAEKSAGEAVLGEKLRGLPKRFYNTHQTDFSGGDLPSAGFLTDLCRPQDEAVARGFDPPGYEWFLPASRNRRRWKG
ncbi:MAG: hypothetical protein ACR650_00180 [Methylocystis sp.]